MQILGVWMWPRSVRVYGAETVASRCARMGVTDIYFLAKGLAGTASYRSAVVPMDSERDLLGELLTAAHRRGIRVHAWLTSASDEHYRLAHPDSGRFHYSRGRDKGLIALTDEGYLSYMDRAVCELCRGFDIDGLHLDYIRYNHLLYGWSEADMARYAAEGASPDRLRALMDGTFLAQDRSEHLIFDAYRAGDESALALARTRRRDVLRFAQAMTSAARAENSRLILSAALMPEGAYDDTAFADLHYGQSYDDAAALYDYALPMAYSNAYGKDSAWVRSVAEGTLRRGVSTVVGLHAYEGGTQASLRADAAALEGTPVSGICLFREGAFVTGFADGRTLTLLNTTDAAVSSVAVRCGSDALILSEAIAPGEERRFALPFAPEAVQAMADGTELPLYIAREQRIG